MTAKETMSRVETASLEATLDPEGKGEFDNALALHETVLERTEETASDLRVLWTGLDLFVESCDLCSFWRATSALFCLFEERKDQCVC